MSLPTTCDSVRCMHRQGLREDASDSDEVKTLKRESTLLRRGRGSRTGATAFAHTFMP